MARRVRGNFARSSGARPNRAWSPNFASAYTVIPAASKVLLATLTPSQTLIDLTVLRVVGGISVASDQAAANEEQIGAFGMIIVTDIAIAAGIASIPGPGTDGQDDWFVHQSFAQQGNQATNVDASMWYAIDSKAKRVLDGDGKAIAVVVENLHATFGLEIADLTRVLDQVRGTR